MERHESEKGHIDFVSEKEYNLIESKRIGKRKEREND